MDTGRNQFNFFREALERLRDKLDKHLVTPMGDVTGPASATNGNMAVFDGTTGKLIKDGGSPSGSGDMTKAVYDTDNDGVVDDSQELEGHPASDFATSGHSHALPDHDHSGDAGDGDTFDAANLTSGGASNGDVLTADGAGNAGWSAPTGGADPDAIHVNVDDEIFGITEKVTPDDADLIVIEDSADSYNKKKVQIANLPTGGGGGTVLKSIWSPDAPPASPDAMDDEFDDASFDTGLWTEYDPGSAYTVAENDHGLELTSFTNTNAFKFGGIYQPYSAGDQSFYTKISMSWQQQNWQVAGMCFWEDATDQTKRIFYFGWWMDGSRPYIVHDTYTAYNDNSPTHVTVLQLNYDGLKPVVAHFRMRIISGVVYMDYSFDGIGWMLFTNATPAYTPGHVGLGGNSQTSAVYARGIYPFFRRRSTTSYLDVLEGQKIALMAP